MWRHVTPFATSRRFTLFDELPTTKGNQSRPNQFTTIRKKTPIPPPSTRLLHCRSSILVAFVRYLSFDTTSSSDEDKCQGTGNNVACPGFPWNLRPAPCTRARPYFISVTNGRIVNGGFIDFVQPTCVDSLVSNILAGYSIADRFYAWSMKLYALRSD